MSLTAPDSTVAGAEIEESLSIVVGNAGDQRALGTESSSDGYMVDLFITAGNMPAGFARYSDAYFDGVLLRGGRISNTRHLNPAQRTRYASVGSIPTDTPQGSYLLCARVDPGGKIAEQNERNNTSCVNLDVLRKPAVLTNQRFRALPLDRLSRQRLEVHPLAPDAVRSPPEAVAPPQQVGGGDARRFVQADGTLVISYPDGSQRRRRPSGVMEYVAPDGTVMIPQAMQVESVDLPTLPDDLSVWGNSLGESLFRILVNILAEAELEAYLQTETNKEYYEIIDWRLRSIRFLTLPE